LPTTKPTPPRVHPWWIIFTFDNPLRWLIHKPEKMFAGLIRQGDTVLDIGCGYGYFAMGVARMVGDKGLVIAADVQEHMLAGARRRAERHGLLPRIRLHLCQPESIGLTEPVDFILAFWMVHEVPDQEAFLRQVRALLKPQARLLIAEPIIHVPARRYAITLAAAQKVGLRPVAPVRVALSRAMLYARE
jgi:ubiquinone/menaquinone biosynthesis C-methylase UbiE